MSELKSINSVRSTPPAATPTEYYSVQEKNETLESISKQTGFPLQDIQDLNRHIKSAKKSLKEGQQIELPPAEAKQKSAISSSTKNKTDLETTIAQSKAGQQGKQAMDQTATVAGYTGKLAEAADPKVAARLGDLDKRIAGLQSDLPKIQSKVSTEVRKAIDLLGSGKITKEEFSARLSQQTRKLTDLQSEMRSVEQEMKSVGQAGKAIGKLNEFGKAMSDLGDVKTTLGKCAFGLDVAFNFAEYQDKDPSNAKYNLTKAINASASNFYLNAAMPKTGAAGAAGALVKFGLECTGFKDTPIYDSVDVATQCLPTDIISKGVVQFMDQGQSLKEIIGSGGKDWSRLERLSESNVKGDNGLVMQGAAILGDVIANGGQNVPTDGPGVRMAESMGVYGHTDILTRDQGRTAQQKVGLVNSLMDGSTSQDDELKILNLLQRSDPRTMAQTLEGLDRKRLVSELQNNKQAMDPVATLVIDTYLKSNQASDPKTQNELRIMAKDLALECQIQGRHEALRDLSSRGLLAKLDIHLR